MKNTKGISITDLIQVDLADHDKEVFDTIKKTTDYNQHSKIIQDALTDIHEGRKTDWSKLDNSISSIEACIADSAFEQGFKMAVKLMFSCLNS